MAAISAADVKKLRDETGLPMMECKSALSEAGGDAEQAKELLQKKYKGKMEKRAGNVTGEGLVAFVIDDSRTSGAIIDLRCETAPVAKTDQFTELAGKIARVVADHSDSEINAETAATLPTASGNGKTVADEIADVFGLLRENIRFHGCRKLSGSYLCGYVHHDGKSGVLVALDAVPNSDSTGTDLCHHIAFSNPLAITRDEIPADQIEEARRMARELAEADGKPEQIIEKIVTGKVNAFCAQNALMEQEHVKHPKTTIGEVLKQAGVGAITGLAYFKIGA